MVKIINLIFLIIIVVFVLCLSACVENNETDSKISQNTTHKVAFETQDSSSATGPAERNSMGKNSEEPYFGTNKQNSGISENGNKNTTEKSRDKAVPKHKSTVIAESPKENKSEENSKTRKKDYLQNTEPATTIPDYNGERDNAEVRINDL